MRGSALLRPARAGSRPSVAAAVPAAAGARSAGALRSQSTYTPKSLGQGYPESYTLQFGRSVEQQFQGRYRVTKAQKTREALARKQTPYEAQNSPTALVQVEHYFGARLVTLRADRADGGRVNAALLAQLRKTLSQLEANPAVNIVLLRGANDSLFGAGADADKLRQMGADPATRGGVLAYLAEAARLSHTLASYTKPLVSVVQGAALGAGAAVALSGSTVYATPSSVIGFPEATRGLVPHGGASYHLSRLPDGLGMYLALTGASVQGIDAYWLRVAGLFGADGVASQLLSACGDLSSDPRAFNGDMSADPVYAKALKALRENRADEKSALVNDYLHEDISAESFAQYLQLKRWYAFMAAGDPASAAASLESPDGDTEDPGDLFDFGQGEAINGRDEFGEPAHAAAAHRMMIGATSGHAAAVRDGLLPEGAPHELQLKLEVIRKAFGGHAALGDPVRGVELLPVKPRVERKALQAQCAAAAKAPGGGLPADWERSRLPGGMTLELAVLRVYEQTEGVPAADGAEVGAMAAAVRAAVPRAWAYGGDLPAVDLDEACHGARVPERQATKDVVTVATAYVVGKLHRLRTPWALVQPEPVARLKADHSRPVGIKGLTLFNDAQYIDPMAQLGLTIRYTSKGELALVDAEGAEYTPKLYDDLHDGVEYGDDERDIYWDMYRRGEGGPLSYPTNAEPLDIAFHRGAVQTHSYLAGPNIYQTGRHATRGEGVVASARASLMTTLAHSSKGLRLYQAGLTATLAARRLAWVRADTHPVAHRMLRKLQLREPAERGTPLARMTKAAQDARSIVISAAASAAGVALTDSEARLLVQLDVPGSPGIATALRVRNHDPSDAGKFGEPSPEDVAAQLQLKRAVGRWGSVVSRLGAMAATPVRGTPEPAAAAASADGSAAASAGPSGARVLKRALPPLSAKNGAASGRKGGAPAASEDPLAVAGLPPAVVLSPESEAQLEDAVLRYATAEAEFLGASATRRALAVAASGDPTAASWQVQSSRYVLAVDPRTNTVTLALAGSPAASPRTGDKSSSLPAGSSAGNGAAAPAQTASEAMGPMEAAAAGLPAAARKPTSASASSSPGSSNSNAAAPWAKLHDFEDPPPGAGAGALLDSDMDRDDWAPEGESEDANDDSEGMWDAGLMRDALTNPEGLVDVFNLPRTPDTLAAAARVTDALKAEAASRVAMVHPRSVEVIEERLRALTQPKGGAAATNGKRAAAAAGAASGARRHLAEGMLKSLLAVPPRARQVTHALVSRAATLHLWGALAAEFRVSARVLTGAGAPDVSGWRLHDASAPPLSAAELESLFAPLPGTDGLAELALPRRKLTKQVAAERAAATESWASQLEAAYEDGTANGVMGDIMRRRYMWYKAPHGRFNDVGEEEAGDAVDAPIEAVDDIVNIIEPAVAAAAPRVRELGTPKLGNTRAEIAETEASLASLEALVGPRLRSVLGLPSTQQAFAPLAVAARVKAEEKARAEAAAAAAKPLA